MLRTAVLHRLKKLSQKKIWEYKIAQLLDVCDPAGHVGFIRLANLPEWRALAAVILAKMGMNGVLPCRSVVRLYLLDSDKVSPLSGRAKKVARIEKCPSNLFVQAFKCSFCGLPGQKLTRDREDSAMVRKVIKLYDFD